MTATPETTITGTKAVRGRRVTYAYANDNRERPGVITGTKTAANGALLALVRLDGARSNLHVPADYDRLTYLDEVGEVPELPMGRFDPSTTSLGFDFHYEGVQVSEFEDGEAVAVTSDKAKAEAALATWMRESVGIEDEASISEQLGYLTSRWVAFEWEPEDAECVWMMHPASEGDEMAVHVFELPA